MRFDVRLYIILVGFLCDLFHGYCDDLICKFCWFQKIQICGRSNVEQK